jgi:phosphinothricin acetyltransferase
MKHVDSPLRIVTLTARHWPEAAQIFAEGIASGHATFEAEPPGWQRFDSSRLSDHRHAAIDSAGSVLGWIAASPVSQREVYAGVVEHSVYVAPSARGRGVGFRLLQALISSTEAAGIWTVQSSIFAENTASLRLHLAAGFRVVGTRERIGLMTYGPLAGQWRDTLLIERRSSIAGQNE